MCRWGQFWSDCIFEGIGAGLQSVWGWLAGRLWRCRASQGASAEKGWTKAAQERPESWSVAGAAGGACQRLSLALERPPQTGGYKVICEGHYFERAPAFCTQSTLAPPPAADEAAVAAAVARHELKHPTSAVVVVVDGVVREVRKKERICAHSMGAMLSRWWTGWCGR